MEERSFDGFIFITDVLPKRVMLPIPINRVKPIVPKVVNRPYLRLGIEKIRVINKMDAHKITDILKIYNSTSGDHTLPLWKKLDISIAEDSVIFPNATPAQFSSI